jgi:DNA invertase Pin-like site-specific DNA recombinase
MTKCESEHFPRRTATYVRMVMRGRELSAGKQMAVVRRYARRHGLKIVREYRQSGGDGKGGALA